MSGMTSQPCLNSIVKALGHTDRDTGLDLRALDESSRYWAAVRELYYPFEEGLKAPESDVYHHEMPGGQYTNLKQQAKSMGLERRWQEVCDAYVAANQLVGDIVKVTPSSKVVGDLALFMVSNGLTPEGILGATTPLHFPQSVVEMMQGMLGQPEGGWPRGFQDTVLRAAHAQPIEGRPGAALPSADFEAAARALPVRSGHTPREEDVLSSLLYPRVYAEFAAHWQQYENTSVIPTVNFFYGLQAGEEAAIEIERGKTLIVRYFTTGATHSDGTRTVFFELNGQAREVNVVDRSVEGVVARNSKADPDNANHVAAPMPGKISTVPARKGQAVRAGERLLSIEAMKMETAVYSPRDTVVADVLVAPGATVEARDLLVVLEG
jgi:pyruvate carboxylase